MQILKDAEWTEEDLAGARKGDAVKVTIARRLRRDTTAGWKWIAVRLKMGHWRSAANAVRAAASTSPRQYVKMRPFDGSRIRLYRSARR